MEPKEAGATRKPWQISGLAWTAAAVAAVCYLLHSLYWHEDVRPGTLTLAFSPTGTLVFPPNSVRIGWPLPFAEGKTTQETEEDANRTQTQVLRQLTAVEIFPVGATADLFLLVVLSFSAAYATERLKEHLRPQVTITGLLGLSTLAAWEVHTAWKPSLATGDSTAAARQIEFLVLGNWGYGGRITRFFIFVACLVGADLLLRAARCFLRVRPHSGLAVHESRRHLWLPWLVGASAALLLSWRSYHHMHHELSEDRLRVTYGYGWPLSLLEETMSIELSQSLGNSPSLAAVHRISTTEIRWEQAAVDIAVWALLTATAFYGVRWLQKTLTWPSLPAFLAGSFLYLCIDAGQRQSFSSWLVAVSEWRATARFLGVIYTHELLQLLIFAACLFIPHMAFALLGAVVSRWKRTPPRAEPAKTG